MKRSLQLATNESLSDWCERIVSDLTQMGKKELLDAIKEISKKSYIAGSNAAFSVMKGE